MKVVICLLLLQLSYRIAHSEKTGEPEDHWEHEESPDELEDMLRDLRKEFDQWAGLKKGDPCKRDGPLYAAYDAMNKALQTDTSYGEDDETFEFKKYNFFLKEGHPDSTISTKKELEKELNARKTSSQGKTICPITKGMICKDNKCDCNLGDDEKHKFLPESNSNTLGTEEASGACYLSAGSFCNEEWETKCISPYNCYVKKDANQPEDDLLCTFLNLEKYNLIKLGKSYEGAVDDGKWKCYCQPSTETQKEALQNVLKTIQNLPKNKFLKHGDTCDDKPEQIFTKLEQLLTSPFPDIPGFFVEDYPKLRKDLKDGNNFLCSKNPDALLVCDDKAKKCACKYKGTYKDSICTLNPGDDCDGDGRPYPCSSGERCTLALEQKMNPKPHVLCTPSTLEELSRFDEISNKCSCSPASPPPKGKFSAKDLDILKEASKKIVMGLLDDERKIWAQNFLSKGATCSWDNDRLFFELRDYINATLEHIFYKTKHWGDLKTMDNKETCNVEKGLRCHFITHRCDCTGDQYLSEPIPADYDEHKGRCLLKKGSLCHPTLTGWLPCQEGEKCFYTVGNVKVECNRENQKKIVANKMRLKSARCTCSSDKDKNVQEIDDALIKKHRYKEKIEF